MSTRFLTDPKIEQLGEKHGPAGPLVIVSLLSHAGQQEQGGAVERTFRATAHETFTEPDAVARILSDAADTAVLTIESQDPRAFKVRFPAWSRHQAAFRQAKARGSSKPHEKANVTGSHGQSQKVPNKTIQNKTKQKDNVATRDEAPLCHLLADLLIQNGSRPPRIGKPGVDAERRLLDLDKRESSEAEALIRWCQGSEFWKAHILSM